MIIPPKFLILKAIPLYNEGDVSAPHIVINYLTRNIFFILLKFSPNKKLMKIKIGFLLKVLIIRWLWVLWKQKKIVDDLTIQYDMNNIYRIRLVE